MAKTYSPLTINPELESQLRAIQTTAVRDEDARQSLGKLLQSALELEFATVPTYLSAAFSLYPTFSNQKVYDLILRVAIEEMLHMSAVANLMNAIGIAPNFVAAAPKYPYKLTVLEPALSLELRSFSFDLIEGLFMRIEAPEEPVEYEALAEEERPRTIGQFYAGIIDIIERDTIPDLFKNAERDAYKQRTEKPAFDTPIAYASNLDSEPYPLKADIDFRITDKASAVRHLSWIVDQGEGAAPLDPLTLEGIPGHFYRFESIVKSRFLVKDSSAKLNYSFSGGDLPLDPGGVHEFDVNAKASAYAGYPTVERQMTRFNETYTGMINLLQEAFNCPSPLQEQQAKDAYKRAEGNMRRLSSTASAIVQKAQEVGIKGGIPFEYAGPPAP